MQFRFNQRVFEHTHLELYEDFEKFIESEKGVTFFKVPNTVYNYQTGDIKSQTINKVFVPWSNILYVIRESEDVE